MSIYLTGLADWLRSAGLSVIEYQGWQTRARSSGGYAVNPLCVMWHHTASGPSWDGQRDADYIAVGDSDAPLSNLYIDRSGTVWVLAAGATNTNGKGNAIAFSRGTVPADGMNTRAIGVEMGNDGVGERWPQCQVDAMFTVSNVCNAHLGNQPDDIATHNFYAPTRKIDPATDNIAGPWVPGVVNSSRSWNRADVQAECKRRAGAQPPKPQPPSASKEVDMYRAHLMRYGFPPYPVELTISADGVRWNQSGITGQLDGNAGVPVQDVTKDQVMELLRDRPGIGGHPFNQPDYLDADLANAWTNAYHD